MKAIILAGGKGTRLWPLSRETYPKQLIDFGGGQSLLQKTIQRLSQALSIEDILISTSEKQQELVQKQIQMFPTLSCLIEPMNRSTGPAILLSLKFLFEHLELLEDETCLVSPSDLYFSEEKDFLSLLPEAERAAKTGAVVTFGIQPTYPETGYGYIQISKQVDGPIQSVERFIEKPNYETAISFLEKGGYFWNSGIFLFQVEAFLVELKKVASKLFNWFVQPYNECYQTFNSLPSISFDHAFMEKTDRIALIPYPSGWSDLGSWDRIYHVLPKDQFGNVTHGNVEVKGTKNSLIFGNARKVAAVGLDDMILVDTENVVLVTQKGKDCEIASLAHTYDESKWVKQHRDYEVETFSLSARQTLNILQEKQKGHWIVAKGKVRFYTEKSETVLNMDETLLISDTKILLIENLNPSPATLVRVEIHNLLDTLL